MPKCVSQVGSTAGTKFASHTFDLRYEVSRRYSSKWGVLNVANPSDEAGCASLPKLPRSLACRCQRFGAIAGSIRICRNRGSFPPGSRCSTNASLMPFSMVEGCRHDRFHRHLQAPRASCLNSLCSSRFCLQSYRQVPLTRLDGSDALHHRTVSPLPRWVVKRPTCGAAKRTFTCDRFWPQADSPSLPRVVAHQSKCDCAGPSKSCVIAKARHGAPSREVLRLRRSHLDSLPASRRTPASIVDVGGATSGSPVVAAYDCSDARMTIAKRRCRLFAQTPSVHSTCAPNAFRLSTNPGCARRIGSAFRMVERPSMLAASMKRAMATRMM